MVGLGGLEPPTSPLSGRRPSQYVRRHHGDGVDSIPKGTENSAGLRDFAPTNTTAWSLQWKADCSPRCQRTVVCVVLVPVDGPSHFIDRSHVWQALYLTNEICEQGRGIVPSPSESERKGHVQIDHR